jgi:hypothetical protein
MLFVVSVVSCLNVLYMYIVYVGVRYCNHDTITCSYLRVLFGLPSSCFISIPIRFPYGVVVLFGTSCCDVPVLFIPMFLQCSLFSCRFICLLVLCLASLYVRLQPDRMHSLKIINCGAIISTPRKSLRLGVYSIKPRDNSTYAESNHA